MATSLPHDEHFQTELLLRQTDERGETASPEDIPVDDETSGPDDPLDDDTSGPEDDDTSGPEEQEDAQADTADVAAVTRYTNRNWLTPAQATVLMKRARARGKKRGRRVERKRVRSRLRLRPPSTGQMVPAAPQAPANFVPQDVGAKKLVDKWRRQGDAFTINQEGHYYCVAEARFTCEGPSGTGADDRAWLRLEKGTKIRFFDRTIDEDTTYLGNSDKVTAEVTNYQRPSRNTYNDQDFLIKSISLAEAGLRIKYPQDTTTRFPTLGTAANVLSGQSWLWDDGGIFLPKEIFHDFSRENMLYRAIRNSSVLYFEWEKKRVGGNGTARSVLVDTAANIPDLSERRMSRTSGGGAVLSVPDGYVFTDNPDASEDGQFTAVLVVQHDVIFPIRTLALGGPENPPVRPAEVGLYVRLSLNGVSFEKAKRGGVVMRG